MSHRASLTAESARLRATRPVTYLRVSVTDRCGLRCFYCSPAGVSSPAPPTLSAADIERVVGVAQGLGIAHVRLTGGEPLERRDIVDIVERLADLGLEQVTLTTNGVRLAGLTESLRDAGLTRVNVSLPHITPEGFERITGRDALGDVLDGIQAAQQAGLAPLKTNTVLLRGHNDEAVCDLVEFGRRVGVTVRLIEYMALEESSAQEYFVPASEALARLRRRFSLRELPRADGAGRADGPARYYSLPDGSVVGIIAPVTEPFCGRCNRLRVTATGGLRPCLYGKDEVDLLPALRSRLWERGLDEAFRRAVSLKPATHGDTLPKAMRFIGG